MEGIGSPLSPPAGSLVPGPSALSVTVFSKLNFPYYTGKTAPCQAFFCPAHRGFSCQKATAAAAATFRESTPWAMGI